MYFYGHKIKIIAIKGNPVDQSIVSASRFTSIKYVKQFRKCLEARTDQHTARKARSD